MSTPERAALDALAFPDRAAHEARTRLTDQYIMADKTSGQSPRERIGPPAESDKPADDDLSSAAATTQRQMEFDQALKVLASTLGQGNLSEAALKRLTSPIEALLADADADFDRTPDDLDAANKQIDFDKLSLSVAADHEQERQVIDAIGAAKPEDREALVHVSEDYVLNRLPIDSDEQKVWQQHPDIFKACQDWLKAEDDPILVQSRQNFDQAHDQMLDSIDFREQYAKVLIDHLQSGLALELIVERLRMVQQADALMSERY